MVRIEDIRTNRGQKTINGAIRLALIERESYQQEMKQYKELYSNLCDDLRELFAPTGQINLKKLDELDKKLFILSMN